MKSSILFGVQLVASAAAAYAFQKVFAFYYGASVTKSILDISLSVPTMLIYLSGFGQTHAIVVALFTRLRSSQAADLDTPFSSLLNASLLLLALFMCIALALSGPFAHWLAPGLPKSAQHATRVLIMCFVPLALSLGVSSHLSAVAIAWRLPMGQELLLGFSRIAVIAFLVVKGHAIPLISVALLLIGSSVVGAAIQWLLVSRATGLKYRFRLSLEDRSVRDAIRQFCGFAVVALTAQLALAYRLRVSTLAGPDVVALIGFAFSISDPLGSILGKLIAFEFGQPLAFRISSNGSPAVLGTVVRLLGGSLLVGSVIGIGMFHYATPLVRMLFGGGAFGAFQVMKAATYLKVMLIGLPGALILWGVVYPLLVVSRHAAAAVYVAGYIIQVILLKVCFGKFGDMTIPMSYAVCLWTQALMGAVLLWRYTSRKAAPVVLSEHRVAAR